MNEGRRIDFSLFDAHLQALINSTAKIFPIQYDQVINNNNPNMFDYVRIVDDLEHKNEIYVWNNFQWELIGADDLRVGWDEIMDKPATYPPTPHTHIEADIVDLDKYTKEETDDLIATKAPLIHNHDTTYQPLGNYSLTTHNHNTIYYTKSEIDTSLAGKSNATHNHDLVYQLKGSYQPAGDYSLNGHNHDGAYYKKSEIDGQLTYKLDNTTFNNHVNNAVIHVVQNEKDNWNKPVITLGITQPTDGWYYKII